VIAKLAALPFAAWVLLVGTFAISIGSYMIVPFLALELVHHAGLSLATVGLAFTAKLWAQSGLAFAGGMISDRYGGRGAMAAGLGIRVVSYLGLAFLPLGTLIVGWVALIGAGQALFAPAVRAALFALAGEEDAVFVYSLQNTAMNAGVTLGPLLGVLLLPFPPALSFTIAAGVFGAFALAVLALLPPLLGRVPGKTLRARDLRDLASSRAVWLACAAVAAFTLGYVQLEIALPSFVQGHYGTRAVGWFFALNAVVVVALQLPLARWNERTPTWWVAAASFAAMGAGFVLVSASALGVPGLLAGIALFSLGELLIMPKLNAATVAALPKHVVATALGLLTVCGAFGGALGNWLGGAVYPHLHALGQGERYWSLLGLALFAAALASGALAAAGRRRPAAARSFS
jgi:DHA1 family multidrug resistance protein-like MFS transporter